jgi:nucleotide-binding universal stress UspA family protein
LERQARQELQTLISREPGIDFGPPVLVFGDPWHRILEVARRIDVDLIVIGNHRYRGLGRVLGTVASKIVNHANRDVLVVQERISSTVP